MLGAIIGDIIGSRFEWHNIKTKEFGLLDKQHNFFTDDTVMTLAVAKALINCNGNYQNLEKEAIENIVSIGIKYPRCGYGKRFKQWLYSDDHSPYNSYGNGSAMRTSPCGIVANSLDEAIELATRISSITHNHPEGIKGAVATTVAIYLAKTGKTKEEIKKHIIDNYYNIDFTLDDIRPSYSFDVSCQGSVPQALEAFFESTDFEDAIRNAISIGGDSDTIAAITGGIASVYYGVPENIKKQIYEFLDDDLSSIEIEFEKEYFNGTGAYNKKNN